MNQLGHKIIAATGVLQFQDTADWRYHFDRMAVQFSTFTDRDEIRCFVSKEYLDDTYGDIGDTLRVAKVHADDITDRIGFMIAAQKFDSDGSVVLRSISN